MGTPQYIYLALVMLTLGIEIERHGKPKKGAHSFWNALGGTALALGLLFWGGFFS